MQGGRGIQDDTILMMLCIIQCVSVISVVGTTISDR